MATTITKTIGVGGDYTTIADWIAAIPANLVTVDQIWRGELLNQAFSVAGQVFNITGKTTDSTRYIELTTAAGCSVFDDVNVRSNPLRYNPDFGARIIRTTTYGYTGQVSVAQTRISKVQIINASSGANAGAALYATGAGIDVNQCVLESSSRLVSDGTMYLAYGKVRNSLIVQRDTLAASIISRLYQGASAYNCDFIATNATLTNGVQCDYGSPVLKNVYIGGITNPTSGGVTPTKTNCFASVAATGFTLAPLSNATFVDVSDATRDFRLVAGSALIDAGVADATNSPTDITGTAHDATTDVGPWEYVAAGTSATFAITADDATFSGGAVVSPMASFIVTAEDAVFSGGAVAGSASAQISATADDSTFSGAAVGDTSSGTITTPALKNNTGTLLANETGITAYVYNPTTGALIVKKTSQTTNVSGVMSIVDALIVGGTQYRVVIVLSSGAEGMDKLTAS